MLLTVHSLVRWFVLLSTVVVAIRCLTGKTWSRADTTLARTWIGVIDTQVTVGLMLYFSAHPVSLFFRALHPLAMALAATVAHIAWVSARRAEAAVRFRRLGRGLACALAITILAIPWPR